MNFLERANLSITFIFAYVMLLDTSYSGQGLPTSYSATFRISSKFFVLSITL